MGVYLRGLYSEGKHFSLQPSFFSSKKYVFWHFSCHARCEIYSTLTIKTLEYEHLKIKLKIKTPEYLKLKIKLKIKTPLMLMWPLYC